MKILIDGVGFIGEVHLKTIKKYELSDIAICDTNQERLEEITEKYNIKEVYSSIDESLKNDFDGVVICTPNNTHASHAIKFLKKGIGVLVEKPMAHNTEAAEEMVAIAEKNNSFIFVAYVARFMEPFIKMKELITSGELGEVFSMRAIVSSRRTLIDAISDYRGKKEFGGCIIHDYSHEIDYSKWFLGEKVKEVFCKGFRVKYKNWETFDSADIILSFKNNKVSSIHLDYIQPPMRRSIEIYGTKGTILWTDCEDIKFYSEAWAKWYYIRVDNVRDFNRAYLKQLQYYISCLKDERGPIVSGRAGLEVVKIIDACIESAENDKIVYL